MTDWRAFVLEYGWHTRARWLAAVVGQSVQAVEQVRRTGAVKRLPRRLDFGELFALWNGRPPGDDEWPAPNRQGANSYEWLGPEKALLAKLVGTISTDAICVVLTERLRRVTGDPSAVRNRNAVQPYINHLGLHSGSDFAGGITTREAAKRVGSFAVISQAVFNRRLRTFRVGKRHVIPREEFERWLSQREQPPDGWIRLATLQDPLGIKSDKLPEYAKLGHIPDVKLVQGIGTARGTWFIAPDRAKQILDDAAAGRPMPWHGKPLPGNQRAMYRKWRARQHRRCRTCTAIWKGPAPSTFEAFCQRYGSLTLGQKRHLTHDRSKPRVKPQRRPRGSVVGRMRDAGVTIPEAAAALDRRTRWIRAWIRTGVMRWGGVVRDELGGEALRITPLGLCILEACKASEVTANRFRSRDWLGVHAAAHHTGVSIGTIHKWLREGSVAGSPGSQGVLFDRVSLEARAREYWKHQRFKRAEPPAWLAAA